MKDQPTLSHSLHPCTGDGDGLADEIQTEFGDTKGGKGVNLNGGRFCLSNTSHDDAVSSYKHVQSDPSQGENRSLDRPSHMKKEATSRRRCRSAGHKYYRAPI